MIKIINFFKSIKNKNFDDFAILFMAVFALIQGAYIYLLKSSNEGLELNFTFIRTAGISGFVYPVNLVARFYNE